MIILALDIATTTGYARGDTQPRCMNCGCDLSLHAIRLSGGLSCCPARKMDILPPVAGSIRFGQPGASNNAVFAHCLKWLSAYLEPQPRPDAIVIESMLPPGAKLGATSRDVRDRLAGLHGIVRAVAHLRGVYQINEHSVGDVRQHFLGDRTLKRDRAKWATVERCQALGWSIDGDNAADACALWSFAVALIRPEQGIKLSPLFNRQLRTAAIQSKACA